ncbi:monocarboxylate transporter 12 [Eupeodes corollae]|uniref:monocarboxylate transporter 12 n=1 Tax=Eupeodes corollae TaxID=290404 RepID=UPI002490612A|nr:monocarboxylate transporter 12 [Eupeodes corollae]XP_055920533.1 monocarboxylate transporter 12 [Eupeodes corollae]XP_055920534.1 monocarboxylate transporter 12 [Eupeodes corollae]
MEMESSLQPNIPNGGWGWIVVAAVAFINMTNQSIPSVFGLLFGGQLLEMKQDTKTASLITNLHSLTLNLSGLFIGPAIKNYSPRIVATIGCLFTTSGLVFSAFSTQVWQFIFGYSFFCGVGQGLIAPSTFMAINSYFTTKRGRAVGVSLAGSGLGQMMIPHLVRICLDKFGFRVAVLALAGFAFHGLIGAAMFRPLVSPQKLKFNNRRDVKLLLDNDKSISEIKILKKNDSSEEDLKQDSKTKKLCNKVFNRLVEAMDLELLRDPVFWSIIIGMALVYTSTTNFTMLFPYFLQNSIGLTRSDTALCMSVVAGADICCRLLLPFITDKLQIPYRTIFLFGTIGLLISRAALAESTSLTTIIIMSAFTGMTKSSTVVNNNLTVSSYCRPEKLAGGLGLSMITKGVLVITVGQLFGWVRDHTGSYVTCLHSQNLVLAVVIAFWTPEILCRSLKKQRETLESGVETGEQDKLRQQNVC